MNKRSYSIQYVIYKAIEFDDEEMRKYGYEGEITEEDREEYLKNLLEDKYKLGCPYDDMWYQRDYTREKELEENDTRM